MKVESEVKYINYPQESVYTKMADLNNLSAIKEKYNDPDAQERLKGQIPEDKVEQVKKTFESMQFDADSVSMHVDPVGNISLKIIERTPMKCIKFTTTYSPVGFYLWIQILPVTNVTSKIKVTIDANVPPFLSGMIRKPLEEGVEKLANMLTTLPYE